MILAVQLPATCKPLSRDIDTPRKEVCVSVYIAHLKCRQLILQTVLSSGSSAQRKVELLW